MKLCVTCKHFFLDMGEPDWSEVTPGSDAMIACRKGHWEMENKSANGGLEVFRANIARAESCADYSSPEG